jgi:uncharacterized protein YegJ (DUF2314 family)
MRFLRSVRMLLPLLLVATACEAQENREMVQQREDVYGVRSGDPETDAAIDRARATLHVFNGYVERAKEDGLDPRLKATFRQGDEVEHMWVGDLTFDGRVYRGILRNRPFRLTNVRQGDKVTIDPARVSDWSVIVDETLLGNFTTLVLRGRMTPGERAQLDQQTGARVVADTAIITLPRRQ